MTESVTAICIACENPAMGECPHCETWFCDKHYVMHVFEAEEDE